MSEGGTGLIAVPAYPHGRWSSFRPCLTELEKCGAEVKEVHGASDAENRHRLAKYAAERDVDWVFWLDDDTLFRPDALVKMLERPEAFTVALCLGRRLNPDGSYAILWSDADETSGCLWRPVRSVVRSASGLMPIAASGFGGMLTRRSVLQPMADGLFFRKHPLDPLQDSTDIDFCWRAKARGHQLWGNPDVKLGHTVELAIWPHEAEGQWSTVLARGFQPFMNLPWMR